MLKFHRSNSCPVGTPGDAGKGLFEAVVSLNLAALGPTLFVLFSQRVLQWPLLPTNNTVLLFTTLFDMGNPKIEASRRENIISI
jgi:hypothetical protein